MKHNRNTPAAPQEWNSYIENAPPGFTKHESASLQILCRLITARGTATDDELTTQAAQIADLWLGKLEVVG